MHGFLDILVKVGSDWSSWIVVGILALWAGMSFYKKTICPIANCRFGPDCPKFLPSPEEARGRLERADRRTMLFSLLMLLGVVLAVAGLFGLAQTGAERGTLSFFTLAVGLFLILTVPVRFQIRDNELRVLSATDPELRKALAYDLRLTHWRLLEYEFGILALLTTIIVAF
ncbi:MAG: hypothetical protein D6754_11405 [Alphaproteobacteria bacterium]|nr:MAG: hypothetical protein D6754_11405 [Alphaproteobacteria bacterium]